MVKSLGAKQVIDYTQEDFANNGEIYDVVFDTVGKSSFTSSLRSLTETGCLILSAASLPETVRGFW